MKTCSCLSGLLQSYEQDEKDVSLVLFSGPLTSGNNMTMKHDNYHGIAWTKTRIIWGGLPSFYSRFELRQKGGNEYIRK
jgi:hypothetical protein